MKNLLSARQPVSAVRRKKIILAVEDDMYYANIYKVRLVKEGYDVTVVGNGVMALEFVRKIKPDLILLDLVLPVMDGFETLKKLKEDQNLAGIKVIVLSNLGQDEDIKRVHELKADDYIIKTNISIQDLVKKINQYLQ